MKQIKDKKIIVLVAILLVFTIVYFVAISKISYAFSTDSDVAKNYELTIDTIKKSATIYAEQNKDLFNEEKTVYIKVQDLIDKQLLATNESGEIINPLNPSVTLNSNIVKIKLEDDKYIVEVDS